MKPTSEPTPLTKEQKHIKEWKYWDDDVLDQVQRFYESDCGYNGECSHVWVEIEGDKLKLPAVENKLKYALAVAGTRRKAIKQERNRIVEIVKKTPYGDGMSLSISGFIERLLKALENNER